MEIKFQLGKLYRIRDGNLNIYPSKYIMPRVRYDSTYTYYSVYRENGEYHVSTTFCMGKSSDCTPNRAFSIYVPISTEMEKLRLSSPNHDIEMIIESSGRYNGESRYVFATDEVPYEEITFDLDGLKFHPGDELPSTRRERRD